MKMTPHLIADSSFRTPTRTMIEPDPEVIRCLLAGIDATDIEDTHAPAPPRCKPLRKAGVSVSGGAVLLSVFGAVACAAFFFTVRWLA